MTMVRDSDDDAIDEARAAASMLQSKQLISTNVVTKRKEQLGRWEKSEMNMEPPHRTRGPTVQFMDDDIFLSACMFGDEDEVDELLAKGADINTGTVDGLTALHQSVIDSKPEMVRFLCEKGANVNSQDNEGWTPLHAAACCGNVAIVQLLVEAGADLRAINCDKELAVDLAENDECRDYLEGEYAARGIDLEDAREAELSTMMRDVKEWTRNGAVNEKPHPKTGATALHVAAAKGYTQIVDMLITAGADVNGLDYDGWTPLHAAAHWGEKNCQAVCAALLKAGANIDATTLAGQNVIGVATDRDILEYLEVEKAKRDAAKEKERAKKETSVLSEKNGRVGSGSSLAAAAAAAPQPVTPSASTSSITAREHPAHLMSTEQKHALTVADERSENETLHPAKVPRLGPLGASSTSVEERPTIPSRTQQPVAAAPAAVPASEEEESGSKMNTSVTRSIGRSSSDRESSASSSITPSERSSSTTSTRNDVPSAAPVVEHPPAPLPTAAPATPVVAPSTPTPAAAAAAATPTTVQFTVPLRSWNRPAPLSSSSARSSTTSTSSSALAPGAASTSAAAAAVSSPTMTSSPLTVKPPPWQSATVASQESESERRQTARMQRAHRRSTQGVTKEQLEEASRLAAEESARRRTSQASASSGSSIPSGPCRLASEEKDSSAERSLIGTTPLAPPRISAEVRLAERRESSERYSDSSRTSPSSSIAPSSREGSAAPSGSLTNTGTLSLSAAPAPSATPSAANVRRKSSQILSGMAARSARRGTGPVSADDIAAAAAAEREERAAARSTTAPPAAAASSLYQPQSSARRLMGEMTSASTTTTTATVTPFQSSTGAPPSGIGRSPSIGSTPTNRDGLSTSVSRVAPRVASSTATSGGISDRSTAQFAAPTISSTAAANVNYRLLYEKERTENEKLRRELERSGAPPPEMNGSSSSTGLSSTRRLPTRLTSSQSVVGGLSKSPSGGSMEDAERRTLERRITELELELKEVRQLHRSNDKLKRENEALVRVLAKLARPDSRLSAN